VAQEDERRRSRERGRLVVERGQHSSRIKGLLMTLGVRDFEPARRDWQLRLDGHRIRNITVMGSLPPLTSTRFRIKT
jgi:transposase